MTRYVLLIALLAGSAPAAAQPAGAQAEVLFREARELMAAGKLAEACAAFEQSQKLEPALTTLLNLANCREKNGQLATAWGLFLEAERQTRTATDAAAQKLHGVAEERAKKLEPRVSKLTITVQAELQPRGLELRRDEQRIDEAMWNRALPIDGGTYTLTVSAPGKQPWSTRIAVAPEGDARTVEVPVLREPAREPAAGTGPAQPPAGDAPAGRASRTLPLVLGASAVALVGGAVGVGLWGRSIYGDAKAETLDQARRDSLYDSANTRLYIAEGLAVAGVACAGAAVWLYLRGRGDERGTVARARHILPTPTGLAIAGAF